MLRSEPKPIVIALLASLALSAATGAEAGQATITGRVIAKEDGRVEVRYELPDDAAPLTGDRVEFRLIIRGVPAGAGSGSVVEVDGSSLWVSGPDLDPPLGAEALIHATGDAEAARSRRSGTRGSSTETTGSPDAERNPVAGVADTIRRLADNPAPATEAIPRLFVEMRLSRLHERAEAGDVEAQLELGRRYRRGEGVSVDLEEAFHWYRQAAEQGDPYAQFRVGYALRTGEGTVEDPERGCDWYERAARSGHATSMNNIGHCYAYGRGRARDIDRAISWYRRAIDAGNVRGLVSLADLYREGLGVAVDLERAFELYRRGAEQGDAYAQFRVGYALRTGEGVSRDSRAGCDWYETAASNGHAIAMNNLGLCYRDGDGRPRDITEASRWFREACDAGNERSCNELSELFQ